MVLNPLASLEFAPFRARVRGKFVGASASLFLSPGCGPPLVGGHAVWHRRWMPALGLGLFTLAVWWVSATAGVVSDEGWWEEWGMGARRVPRCCDIYIICI